MNVVILVRNIKNYAEMKAYQISKTASPYLNFTKIVFEDEILFSPETSTLG